MDNNQGSVNQTAPPAYSDVADSNHPEKPAMSPPQAPPSQSNQQAVYMTAAAPNTIFGNRMAPQPTALKCKSCNQHIVTRTEWTASKKTHILAAMSCILCLLPCVVISYAVDSWRNTKHYCPNCDAEVKYTPRENKNT